LQHWRHTAVPPERPSTPRGIQNDVYVSFGFLFPFSSLALPIRSGSLELLHRNAVHTTAVGTGCVVMTQVLGCHRIQGADYDLFAQCERFMTILATNLHVRLLIPPGYTMTLLNNNRK